jgi:hypothetical protein
MTYAEFYPLHQQAGRLHYMGTPIDLLLAAGIWDRLRKQIRVWRDEARLPAAAIDFAEGWLPGGYRIKKLATP